MKRLFSGLVVVHRYVGLVLCLVFLAWFASGLVMIYRRMPVYTAAERLARLPALDPAGIHLTPKGAAEAALLGEPPRRVVLTSLLSRPAYRFFVGGGSVTVFADDGSIFDGADDKTAVTIVQGLFPEHRTTIRVQESLMRADQWTIGTRFDTSGALHRVSLGDEAGTDVYVAEATGDVVMKTDRASRFWGYVGPVLHWFYFTPLRARQAPLWNNLVVYGSLVGCLVCLSGLVIGVYRFSMGRRFLHGTSYTPYARWLKWHHYAGLVFGVITFTWTLSGLITMTPWDLLPTGGPTRAQAAAVEGEAVDVEQFSVPPAEALAAFRTRFAPREMDLIQFMGTPFYAAFQRPDVQGAHEDAARYAAAPDELSRVLVNASGSPRIHPGFTQADLLAAARAAMPGVEPAEVTWLTAHDAYYYERSRTSRLPALRVKFGDADATWFYLDARDGSLALAETRASRAERWLYQGLHSLDFPGFYQASWIWYPVMVLLGLGGTALSLTSVIVGWRYLRGRA